MNVLNAAKHSARGQLLDYICESTQERNHMSVLNVGRPSAGSPDSVSIRGFILGINPETAARLYCENPSNREKPCKGAEGTWELILRYNLSTQSV